MLPHQFDLHDSVIYKWISIAQDDIIHRFNLKLQHGLPDYPCYYFVKKNTNRYFRKHLGFTFCYNSSKLFYFGTITVTDQKKLMIFRLKYNL